jgi:predicted RND superfamily exporter protein
MDDPRLELLARKLLPPPEEASRIDRPIFFKTAQTGPRAVERMTEEPLNLDTEEAVDRLTGALIGDIDPQDEQTRGENNAADLTEAEVDDLQTCLVLTLSDAARANLHGAIDTIKNVAVEECGIPEETLHMGGPPVDNVSIDRAGQTSVTLLFGLSLVVGFFVSWWSLKSKMLVGLVLASGVYSMFASLAIVWYSGYPVDAILLTMPSLVYVATTSGAIHLANYYRDQLAETGVLKGAAGASVRHALLPLSLATGTTAVGLATLAVSVLVPIKMFGIFSAIGVVVSFIILITFMPACLELFPPKLRLGKESGDDTNDSWRPIEESPWWGVGHWITRHNIVIATICLVVMAGIGYGMTRVESSVQLMRLFSPQARIRQDYRWLEKNLGPLVPMEILIRCDQEECDLNFLERMELVDEIQREIGELGEVGSSLSTVTFGRSLDVGGGGIGGAAGRVFGLNARTRRSVLNRRLVAHREEFLDGDYLREAKVESEEGIRDQELWRISARVSATKEVDYADFKRDLQSKIDPILASYDADGTQGISVDYTGLVPLVYKAQHSLLDGLIVGFISDFAIIVLVMVLLCRAASAGLVLLLPAAFPAVVVFGGMGWGNALLQSFGTGNLLIDIGTVMAPCVALGVTVDDVVHFMLWFRRGISDGMDRKEATMLAYKGCARAMYQSWGVIGIGLSVFSLSPFGPTQRFGHMMLAMLTVALVGNLVLLPALLAGPLGDIFGWSVLRLNQKKSEKNSQRRVKSEAGTDTLPQPHVLPEPATKQVVHA